MPPKSFEEQVLEARAADRDRYASALANTNGPAPYSKGASEDDQDKMWNHVDKAYTADPPEVEAVMRERIGMYMGQKMKHEQAVARAAADVLPLFPQSPSVLLVTPKEMGGQGLTPLAASYMRRPFRKDLIEGAGVEIEQQIEYAKLREKRAREKQQPEQPTMGATPATPAPTPPQEGGSY